MIVTHILPSHQYCSGAAAVTYNRYDVGYNITSNINTDLSATPAGGATIHVANGGDLQAALDAAVPGDKILLAAGAIFTGNYTISERSGGIANNFIWVMTDGSLPAEHSRLVMSAVAGFNLPKILTPNGTEAIRTIGSPTKFRFIGIEFAQTSTTAPLNACISIGDSTGSLPSDFIIDRCYVHGIDYVDVAHPADARRGIALNCRNGSVIDSTVNNWHSVGFDTQAVHWYITPGWIKLYNNTLESSSECIASGGADPAIFGINPDNIEIIHNLVTRRMSWKDGPFLIKNLLELKVSTNVNIQGNIFENSWPNGQLGWAFVFWSVDQNAGNPVAETGHITCQYNLIRNVASGFQVSDGYHDGAVRPFVPLHHVNINNNLFIGFNNAAVTGGGLGLYIANALDSITYEHNTLFTPNLSAIEIVVNPGTKNTNLKINNNLTGGGTYPVYMLPGSWTEVADAATSEFNGNVVYGENADYYHTLFGLPSATNSYPASITTVALAGGDSAALDPAATPANMALAGGSPYLNFGTDELNPGANIAGVLAATSGVDIS